MTPKEFYAIQVGYRERERAEYNKARLVGYLAIRPHLDKKYHNTAIDEIIPFAWEKESKKKAHTPITIEEFEALKKAFNFE